MPTVRLHAKFLILVIGILLVSFGVLSTIIIHRENRILSQKSAEKEHLLASTIVADLKDNMLTGRPRSTLSLMNSLQGAYGLVRLDVLRRDGTPAFGGTGGRIVMPQIEQVFQDGVMTDFNVPGVFPVHTNIFPLKNEQICRRCHAKAGEILGVMLISHSLEDAITEIEGSRWTLVMLFSVIIIVTGAAMYIAVRRVVLAPLGVLHRGAELIGSGDLTHRIDISAHDEFRDLADTFNEMAGRVKASYAELENLVKMRTAELNESVRLLRGILSSMSSGIVLLGRDGTIKLLNRQGALILHCRENVLVGRRIAEVVPETAAFLSSTVGTYEEIVVQPSEGPTVPIGFTSSYYQRGDANEEGIIVVFQDLTDLKALQAELLNKERFAAMGRVVAGVAHEIRNPLFGISAIGQIFERDLKDPAHQELSRALISETKRLNQLVEELLIYGRPMKLNLEEGDMRIVMEEVLGMNRDDYRRRNIKVIGDYAPRHPLVHFDAYQMRQVFLNLVRNALEATPDNGTISISMLLEDHFIVFRIADTGVGIPLAHLEHVFDLFFTTKAKGTGLGLAICRKIMQDHGGDISVDSIEGQGTTVTVRLPYRSSPQAQNAAREQN